MPAILLIRHGQASFGTADYDVLSETGVRQAAAVRAGLEARGIEVDRFVSGSMKRQLDTLAPWANDGIEVEIDARWDEYGSDDVITAHADILVSPQVRDGVPQISSRQFQEIVDPALRAWVESGGDGAAAETWPMFRDRVTGAL